MRRRPSFRHDNDLQKEFRRVNKLVQNKQSRLRVNKGLEVSDVQTEKYQTFNSRKDIEKYLDKMGDFLERSADFKVKNEKDVELQYSDIKEIEKVLGRVNKQKEKQWEQVKDLPFTHRGKPTSMTVEQRANPIFGMGDPRFEGLKKVEFDPNKFKSLKAFQNRHKEIMDVYGDGKYLNKLNELYRDNYLKAIDNNLGYAAKHLRAFIEKMPLRDFIQMYYTEGNADIGFIYDKLAVQSRVNELERVWGAKKDA